jgi:hypothetical protein
MRPGISAALRIAICLPWEALAQGAASMDPAGLDVRGARSTYFSSQAKSASDHQR